MSGKIVRKRKKKAKRQKLPFDFTKPRPALVCAGVDGVEAQARSFALTAGHGVVGYVPLQQPVRAGELLTTTAYPAQALKWNVHAAQATLLLTADPTLFGRALQAREWCHRYGKPWLHLWPGCEDQLRLEEWLRTHAVIRLHVTGPASWQAPNLSDFVEEIMSRVCAESKDCAGIPRYRPAVA